MKTLIETLCDAYDIVDRDCYPPEVCDELAPAAEMIQAAIVMVEDQTKPRSMVVPALIVVTIVTGIVAAVALVAKI